MSGAQENGSNGAGIDTSSNGAAASSCCSRCGAPARLQCPKCIELNLSKATSVYCSQDCFKAAWPEHKKVHTQQVPDAWLYCLKRGKARSAVMPTFAWTGPLRPGKISPAREIPAHIPKPDYFKDGYPRQEQESKQQNMIPIYNADDIKGIRAACRLGREVLDLAHRSVRPGITTDELDRIVHEATIQAGAYPSPYNYFNFPKSVCTSVNEVICHGIPDDRELQSGDIVNVDVTAYLNGYHGDLNETFVVGEVDDASKKLVKAAHDCLMTALASCKPGVRYRDMGDIITKHATSQGCSVVRSYCGHGIGQLFHCAPNIPHHSNNKAVGLMKEGHVFTIEPMLNAGSWRDQMWPDQWTAVTEDGARSAQFEHTVLVVKDGVEILTARLDTSPALWWEAPKHA